MSSLPSTTRQPRETLPRRRIVSQIDASAHPIGCPLAHAPKEASMEGFAIASQYLISKRRLDLSDMPVLSGLTRLLVAVAIIGIAIGGLELAAHGKSIGPRADSTIADARLIR
jgi:hypothetical protein